MILLKLTVSTVTSLEKVHYSLIHSFIRSFVQSLLGWLVVSLLRCDVSWFVCSFGDQLGLPSVSLSRAK